MTYGIRSDREAVAALVGFMSGSTFVCMIVLIVWVI